MQLDALGEDVGVRAFAVHPGPIMTPLQRHLSPDFLLEAGWVDEQGNLSERFKTPEQGAATATWAATSPRLEGMGGVYCENCDIAEQSCRARPPRRSRASTRTRSTPRSRSASGPCRRSSPV